MQYLDPISKTTEWSLLVSGQTIQYHNNPSLCSDQECWRSWSWTVLWGLTRPSRTDTQKRHPFHYRGLDCKSRKSRDTWCNRQIWPLFTKWSRQRLTEFCQENPLVTATPSVNNTRKDSTHGHHQLINTKIKLIIFFATEGGDDLYSQEKQDWEMTVA